MARRYFWNKSREWLEEKLDALNEEQATGKTLISWSAGDSSASKALDPKLPITERIRRVLSDLSLLDPDTYPPADFQKIDRIQSQVYTPGDG